MASERIIRSLALSVHFRQPSFGMRKYEILSRATAFLLAVDPPKEHGSVDTPRNNNLSAYDHLKSREEERKTKELKRNYMRDPAGGPEREATELGWLEFCPTQNRPTAHVIASSHVLSPWKWKEYYAQDWISQVTQEHCSYSLDVICSNKPDEPLAKFALNPYPIHHPENIDLSIIHLKNETAALKHMMDLGVNMLHLRDPKEGFSKGETVFFTGFEIAEDSVVDKNDDRVSFDKKKKDTQKDDTRIFNPYTATGSLMLFSPNRYIASTPSNDDPAINTPLPQGLCGGPVLNATNEVCGVVEGIVPIDHSEASLAGAAAFIPVDTVDEFVNWAECFMLEKIVPSKLFEKIKLIKEGKDPMEELKQGHDLSENSDSDGEERIREPPSPHLSLEESKMLPKELENLKDEFKKRFTQKEVDSIFAVVKDEQKEVMDILQTEGGDIDDIVARVRARTREKQIKMIRSLQAKEVESAVSVDVTNEDKKT